MHSLNDVMQMVNVKERTARRHLEMGILKGTKVANKWIFSEDNVKEYMKSRTFMSYVKKSTKNLMYDYIYNYGNFDRILTVLNKTTDEIDPKELSSKIIGFENIEFRLDKKADKYLIVFLGDLEATKVFLSLF